MRKATKLLMALLLLITSLNLGVLSVKAENDFNELINGAEEGSTIVLENDYTIDQPIALAKDLSFDLNGHTISANLEDKSKVLFTINSSKTISFANGTLTSTNQSGRGFEVKGTLNLDNMNVNNFYASGDGGAIHEAYGTVNINNSVFENNQTDSSGGTIALSYTSKLNINNSEFRNNSSWELDPLYSGGGAIYSNWSAGVNVVIDNTTFKNNHAEACGGALHASYLSTYTINNSTFEENDAFVSGGAIHTDCSEFRLSNSKVINNKADYETRNWSRQSDFQKEFTFEKGHGGGLYLKIRDYRNTILENNLVDGNYASGRGGGMSIYLVPTFTYYFNIKSGVITNNEAGAYGGGIDYSRELAGNLRLKNALIAENTAPYGGGIWICAKGSFYKYSTLAGTIINNTATIEGDDVVNDTSFTGSSLGYSLGYGWVRVTDRDAEGYPITWYIDEANNRYKDSTEPVIATRDYLRPSSSRQAQYLHGESENNYDVSNYDIIIMNNTSHWHGGGIAANSPVIMGQNADVDVKVHKSWEGEGELPEAIYVNLIRVDENNEELVLNENVKITAEDEWTKIFYDLPYRYMDEEGNTKYYSYKVTESKLDGYKPTITTTYASWVFNVEIVNKPVEYTQLSVNKIWDDVNNQDGKRPESITVELLADGIKVDEVILNEENAWSHTFDKLEKYNDNEAEINYSISESKVEEYTSTSVFEKDEAGNSIWTITNSYTPGKTYLEVSKVWNDNDNQDGIRPNEITVQLLKNNEPTEQVLTLNNENAWTGSFVDLDEYENGQLINYSVQELSVEGYEGLIEVVDNKVIITNTHNPLTTSVPVKKIWEDENNIDNIRPENVVALLLADGEVVSEASLSESNGWSHVFNDLPVYKNGQAIVYTVDEIEVDGYEKRIEGNTIINHHTPVPKEVVAVSQIAISKVNEDGDYLKDATIKILNSEGQVINEYTTQDKQEILELNPGSYTFTEVSAPEGYELVKDFSFEVSADGKLILGEVDTELVRVEGLNIIVTDPKEKDILGVMQITISKTNKDGNLLEGAALKILDKDGNVLEEWASTNTAHALELDPGIYTFSETSAPEGYEVIKDFKFEVSETGSLKFVEGDESLVKISGRNLSVVDPDKEPEPEPTPEVPPETPVVEKEEPKPTPPVETPKPKPVVNNTPKPSVPNTSAK